MRRKALDNKRKKLPLRHLAGSFFFLSEAILHQSAEGRRRTQVNILNKMRIFT